MGAVILRGFCGGHGGSAWAPVALLEHHVGCMALWQCAHAMRQCWRCLLHTSRVAALNVGRAGWSANPCLLACLMERESLRLPSGFEALRLCWRKERAESVEPQSLSALLDAVICLHLLNHLKCHLCSLACSCFAHSHYQHLIEQTRNLTCK